MYHAVTETEIATLVDAFYSKVREDELLGPIFADAIGDNWEPHLTKMKAFWSSVLLASRTYKGNPMMSHLRLPRLTHVHFNRWLELWRETAPQVCSESSAALFIQKAEMIGERLLYAISMYHQPVVQEAAQAMAERL